MLPCNRNYLLTLNVQHIFLPPWPPSCCFLCFSLYVPHSLIPPVFAAQIDPITSSNLQNSAQPVRVGELQHRHTPTSAWKVGKRDPWDLFLQPSQGSALRTQRLEHPRVGHSSLGPRSSLYQGWWLTHPPRSLPFSQGRQFLMQSWKFSATSLCACSWRRGLWVDFWKAIMLITG